MARVAIQILLYKSSSYLPTVLSSLKAQTYTEWELWCLENSADAEETARSKKILDDSGIAHHFVESAENTGFAGGHNLLFSRHNAELVLMLNADAYLAPGYLAECVKKFDEDEHCASVSGLVYRWTRAPALQGTVDSTTLVDTAGLSYRFLAGVVDRFAGFSRSTIGSRIDEPCKIFGVSGALAVYRRSSVVAASPEQLLFDPRFFMYKEDVDLAIRLKRKGFSSWYVPSAVAFHERGIKEEAHGVIERIRAERRRPARLRESSYRNQLMLYVYHASFKLGLRDLMLSVMHECIRAVFVCVSSPRVFIHAWGKFLKGLPSGLKRRNALLRLGLANVRLDI